MQDSTVLVMLTFVCLMTGIYSPGTVVRSRFPSKGAQLKLYNSSGIIVVLVTGMITFFNQMTYLPSEVTNASAFVFFDPITNEELAVYRMTPTNFSNYLSLEVQERTVINESYVRLEILLTNQLQEPFIFNSDYLFIFDDSGQEIIPTMSWVEGEPIIHDFVIDAKKSVRGTFLYLKSGDDMDFQLKYLPISS